MKIFVQSKSGNHNFEGTFPWDEFEYIVKHIRECGGYYVTKNNKEVFVPFSEIEFIRKDD
jgi:hypothetical protein